MKDKKRHWDVLSWQFLHFNLQSVYAVYLVTFLPVIIFVFCYIAEQRRVKSNPVRFGTHYFLRKTSLAYNYQPKSNICIMKHYSVKKLIENMWYETLSFQKYTWSYSVLYQSTRIKRVLCCSAGGICLVIKGVIRIQNFTFQHT